MEQNRNSSDRVDINIVNSSWRKEKRELEQKVFSIINVETNGLTHTKKNESGQTQTSYLSQKLTQNRTQT